MRNKNQSYLPDGRGDYNILIQTYMENYYCFK